MININKKLYEYIKKRGAEYKPNYKEAKSNINNDNKKNLIYLGTYFPRSFKEAYEIYKNIFLNKYIFEKFQEKENINILDIGSGTGGNLIGLIQVLNEVFRDKKINIISIDGNDNALLIQKDLIGNICQFIDKKNKINYEYHIIKFQSNSNIKSQLNEKIDENYFDIIQSYKFLNELYNMNNNNAYYKEVLELSELHLKENGLLCLVDITNEINIKVNSYEKQYMSKIINKECIDYLTNNSDLVYIIPKCCALIYKTCEKKVIVLQYTK